MKEYDYLDSFIKATADTFVMLFGTEVKSKDYRVKKFGDPARYLSAVVGFSGNSRGLVALSFDEKTICEFTEKIYGTKFSDLSDEVIDTAGEIVNVIAGYVKQYLPQYDFEISLPSIVSGNGHSLQTIKGIESIIIPLDSDLGEIHMEVVLSSN